MRKFVLAVGLVLMASGAQAASYQQNDGTIVDPIQFTGGGNHGYSGPNLQPGTFLEHVNLQSANLDSADLSGANLFNANLTNAFLSDADLTNANLFDANLTNAFLSDANLTSADLRGTNLGGANLTLARLTFASLFGADLSNAILANVVGLPQTFGNGSTLYNANTDFTGTFFDPVAAGWTLVAVPEPSTALLLVLGLVGLGVRGRILCTSHSRKC